MRGTQCVGEEESSWLRCLRGRRCLRRGLWGAGCAKGGGVLTVLPEMNVMLLLGSSLCPTWTPRDECDAASGFIAVSHLDVLSHLFLAATIQMIMMLELWPLFIFSLLAGLAGMRSEPKVETVEDAGVWKVPSSDPWYKGHCTH